LVIVKSRDGVVNWVVGHQGLNGGTTPWNYYLVLQTTGAQAASITPWNNSAPTSTLINVGTNQLLNEKQVAYCFAEIPGFSKIFSYTGNGSADGPFVHCGFKPKFVLMKAATTTGNWILHDIVRNTYNVADLSLYPNLSQAEDSGASGRPIDVVSNGFKLRSLDADFNSNTNTYIGIAFADVPAKYSLAR